MTTLATAARNAACDAVVDLVDAGAGAGNLVLKSAGGAVLCTIALAATAFGAAVAGVADLAGTPLSALGTAAAGAGTDAATCELQDGDGTVVVTGTVGITGSGADLELDNVSVAEGVAVNVTAFSYTQPAVSA